MDRNSLPAPRVAFSGVAQASPLGVLLGTSLAGRAKVVAGDGRAVVNDSRWMQAVRGTSLQWWGSSQETTTPTADQEPPEILIDLSGLDASRIGKGRRWRVVDGSGEPILNPFCFLETCCSAPFIASLFLLESLAGESGWTVIEEAHISSRLRYRELLDRVGRLASHLVASALHRAAHGTAKPTPWHGTAAVRSRSRAAVAAGRLRAAAMRSLITLRDASLNEYWAIGALSAQPDSLLHSQILEPDRWIQPPPSTYFADPFPWPERSDIVLCEGFDYRISRGTLRALTMVEGNVVKEQTIDLHLGDVHLSYPYIFCENGRVFLLPEMEASGALVLFELLPDTTTRTMCTINSGTRIADPTLFLHGGLYWIAYTDQGLGISDNLCLLYAETLHGPWTPHPLNPVKVDIRSSRPGGTPFSVDGKLLRPAQDCSVTYGGALRLNLIRACTPTVYEEEPIAVLRSDPQGPFPHGSHTLSIDGTRLLVDAKRLFVDPKRLWKRTRAYITRAK